MKNGQLGAVNCFISKIYIEGVSTTAPPGHAVGHRMLSASTYYLLPNDRDGTMCLASDMIWTPFQRNQTAFATQATGNAPNLFPRAMSKTNGLVLANTAKERT